MKLVTSLLLGLAVNIFLLFSAATAQVSPTWTRVVQLGGSGASTHSYAAHADAAGNTYQTGTFTGTIQCGAVTLTVASDAVQDTYLVKTDAQGNIVWARQAGSTSNRNTSPTASTFGTSAGEELAIDVTGNVCVTGHFSGTVTFGASAMTLTAPASAPAIFLAKYNAQGDIMWVQQGQADKAAASSGLAVASNGDIFIAGSFNGSIHLGQFILTTQNGLSNTFLAKYNSSGTLQWAQSAGATNRSLGYRLRLSQANNLYLSGLFTDKISFGALSVPGYGKGDAFIAQFDGQGTVQWIRAFGGSENDYTGDLAVTATGEVYAVGSFAKTATFDTTILTSAGGTDGFLVKCSAQGTPIWARSMGGISDDNTYLLLQHPTGSIYVGGDFQTTSTFDTQTLVSAGGTDAFVARYDQGGNVVWAARGGGVQNEYPGALSYSPQGLLQLHTDFSGTTQFGAFATQSRGYNDVLICQLQDNTALSARNLLSNNVSVYPNPVTGATLNLTGVASTIQQLQILDALSRPLLTQSSNQYKLSGNNLALDISHLPTGWYTLEIMTAEGILRKAFLIK